MSDPFLDIAYDRAHRAQQRQLKRRRATATRTARLASLGLQQIDPLPARSPSQRRGAHYEDLALHHLLHAGLLLLGRNLRCRTGEIDLIMRDGTTLVFIEVRARAHTHYGGAAASIDHKKRSRLIRSAMLLLPSLTQRHWQGLTPPVRFDVVAFDDNQLTWLRAAINVEGTP